MTPWELLERFIRQLASAAAFVCLAWLAMEKFVPGFIVPFANLPFFALLALCLLAFSVFLPSTSPKTNIIFRVSAFVIAGLIGWYAYAKVDISTSGLLLAIALGLASLVLFRKLSDPGSSPG